MKKVVITILGLIGHTRKEQFIENHEIKDKFVPIKKEDQATYSINDNVLIEIENHQYINMFNLITKEKFFNDYDIVAIGTRKAIEIQKKVLEYDNIKRSINYSVIEDETYYNELFKQINSILSDSTYDEIIFDVSHGFRHLPILATVALIIQNIRNTDKIKNIFFAKEIDPYEKYEIIDLQEYLDLASLSFIITNFKDNYTISKHIMIKDKKYKILIERMNNFSSDVMSLSLENLLSNTSRKLIESIDDILKDNSTILNNELKELKEHLLKTFIKRGHRYLTYYYLAEDLAHFDDKKERGYLVHSLALIFEAIGFYLKSNFESYSDEIKIFIKEEEIKIEKDKSRDYYKLTDSCRSFLFFDEGTNKNNFFNQNYMNKIYKHLNLINDISKFQFFAKKVKKMRNNLLHANSGNSLSNPQKDIKDILNEFKKYCIDDDILHLKIEPKDSSDEYEKRRQEKINQEPKNFFRK